jgi:hypothetical protein
MFRRKKAGGLSVMQAFLASSPIESSMFLIKLDLSVSIINHELEIQPGLPND